MGSVIRLIWFGFHIFAYGATDEQVDGQYQRNLALQDEAALTALYNSASGASWLSNSNWMTGSPCASSWFGVTCVSSSITSLDLKINNLIGTLPSELGVLSSLTTLLLHSNLLSGTIPSQVGTLTSMVTWLRLHENRLTGTIPSQFGLLKKQNGYIMLFSNSLNGTLPSEIGQLSNYVDSINFYSNQLTGSLPSEIGQMTKMKVRFQIDSNSFSGIFPSQIGQLTAMTASFSIAYNSFCGEFPSEVAALTSSMVGYNFIAGNSFGTLCCDALPSIFTCVPSPAPSVSYKPTISPTDTTYNPTIIPSVQPSTTYPTAVPTTEPTTNPPTFVPTNTPTVECLSGSYFDGVLCTECSIGYYSSFSSAPYPSICTVCPNGQYGTQTGATECLSCATGKVSSSDRTYCRDCEAGEYTSNSTCISCEFGRYAPQALSDSCLECGAGSSTNNITTKATTCTSCDSGTYSNSSSIECTSCSIGKYSISGASECEVCAEGSVAPMTGSAVCTACSAGTFTISVGSETCTVCPLGTYQGSTGQSACLNCEAGKYASVNGSISCSSCGTGTTSLVHSQNCLLAEFGYFLVDSLPYSCPNNAFCPGNKFLPIPTYGYWIDRSSLQFAHLLHRCSSANCERKIGLSNYTCWSPNQLNNTDTCNSDLLQCNPGSGGPLCGACLNDYTYQAVSNTCEKCDSVQKFAYTLIIIIVMLFVCVLILIRCQHRFKLIYLSFVKPFTFLEPGSLKVIWVTYQIIVSASFSLSIEFPAPFSSMLGSMSIFSFDFFALKCLNQTNNSYYFTTYLWCLIPFVIACLIFIISGIRLISLKSSYHDHSSSLMVPPFPQEKKKEEEDDDNAIKVDRLNISNQTAWMLLLLSYLVLPPISSKQLAAYDCITLPSGRYLRSDTSIDCNSSEYDSFIFIITFFTISYQLIPILWMIVLYQIKDELNPSSSDPTLDEIQAMDIRDNNPNLNRVDFLIRDYKCSKWWFEVVDMYRRIVFVGILPLIPGNDLMKSSFGCVVAIISIACMRELEPYRVPFTNVIANVAQYTILLTFYAALSINADAMIDFGMGDFGVGVFMVLMNSVVFVLVLFLALQRYKQQRKERRWRRALTTAQMLIVNHVMDEEYDENSSMVVKTNPSEEEGGVDDNVDDDIELVGDVQFNTQIMEKNKMEKNKVQATMLKQYLIQSNVVVMIKKVGAGAFGEVFKGTCMGEPVAIKTMIDVTEPNVLEFRSEILLTATLRHPNIVNFVGACWGKELMCLVLEWVAKGSLRDLLGNKDLRWNDPLLRLATDIARGMNYLHNRSYYDEQSKANQKCVLHRDLKPDNALISDYTAAKLADFGTSRAKGEEDVTMTAVGTPLYVAPEIARGELYDEKVDVYSFGLTLMEMSIEEPILDFIGARWVIAFDKKKIPKQPMRLIRPMTEDGWRPVTNENPISFAPPTINSLIVRCCAHNPSHRPSFHIILEELDGMCKAEIGSGSFARRALSTETLPKLRHDQQVIEARPFQLSSAASFNPKPFVESFPEDTRSRDKANGTTI